MKHRLKPTSNKFMVVLTFILGLYLGKAAVCNPTFHLELNGHQLKSTSSRFENYPPMLYREQQRSHDSCRYKDIRDFTL